MRSQKHSAVGLLRVREINDNLGVGIETILLHVADNARDHKRLFRIEPETFADRIIMRPEALSEFLIDDDNALAVRRVVIREKATLDQGYLHRRKIIRVRTA